jgi:adenosylmethionine-8-amino-7-oxononanoate aminotransferase
VLGATGAIELDHDVDVAKTTQVALDNGVWIRPFANLIYTMPPYVCTASEVEAIGSALVAATEVA